MRVSLLFLLFWAVFLSECPAKELTGKKAHSYIGNLTEKTLSQDYSAIVLKRHDSYPMTAADTDGLILNPHGDRYKYIRRQDSDHSLKINVKEGSIAEKVTKDKIPAYEKLISENKLRPSVILDKQDREVCIVYCAFNPCYILWHKNKKGEILLDVREKLMGNDFTGFGFLDRHLGVSK